jgi:hypothetical protein
MKYTKLLPKPGTSVIITKEPPDLFLGMDVNVRDAVSAILGKPILLVDYDADGRAELTFKDRKKASHFVYVDPTYIKAAK